MEVGLWAAGPDSTALGYSGACSSLDHLWTVAAAGISEGTIGTIQRNCQVVPLGSDLGQLPAKEATLLEQSSKAPNQRLGWSSAKGLEEQGGKQRTLELGQTWRPLGTQNDSCLYSLSTQDLVGCLRGMKSDRK